VFCSGNVPLCPCAQVSFPISLIDTFSVFGFMWRSLIHLELSFVQGDKNGFVQRLPTDWERIFTNPKSYRGLISNIYKELKKMDSRKSNIPIKTMGYRAKHIILNWWILNGWDTPKKCSVLNPNKMVSNFNKKWYSNLCWMAWHRTRYHSPG
jgi:hypothetical protein